MALTATVHHYEVSVSDVERGVYTSLDLRLAQHPSESMRYLLARTLAYCLSYEEGIGFSKGGLSATDEPPVAVRDLTGVMQAWIDVGSPSGERLHKAAKLAPRVSVFTYAGLEGLRRAAADREIFRAADIAVWQLEPGFLDALEAMVERRCKLEVLRSDGILYVTVGGKTIEAPLSRATLV